MKPLRTGYAYHGNRMLHHAEEDLKDMAAHHGNIVVHMLSHTDWDRHKTVIKDMIAVTEGLGMEAWVDNWGLGGPPGDKSHFLAYYPDSHVYYSDGSMDPVRACLNSPDFRKFTKEWIDVVEFTGAKKIFWDEPHLPEKRMENGKVLFACACPRCKKLFKDRYGYTMPEETNGDVVNFQLDSIVDYFREVTSYSVTKNMENAVCVMLGTSGISLESVDRICSLDTLTDVGSDPYWVGRNTDVYEYVYNGTKHNISVSEKFGKDHNLWIQTFNNPRGEEEDIITAAEACYDAGARTILAWGYYGSISNDYRAKNPLVTKIKTEEAFRRIWDRERDRILAEKRQMMREKYGTSFGK